MRLYSIEYSEFKEESFRWSINDLTFININLLVGKNATGKSRVLRLINSLAKLIIGTLNPTNLSSGYYKVVLKDNSNPPVKPDITYEIEIFNSKVIKEILIIGENERLTRTSEPSGSAVGKLYFEELDRLLDVQIPENNLAVTLRRDTKQHSFLESLHTWANSVKYYEFANRSQNDASIIDKNIKSNSLSSAIVNENIHLIVKFGKEKFGRDLVSSVCSDMKKVGYDITDFGLMPTQGIPSHIGNSDIPQALYLKEVGIDKKLGQVEISAGMYRALVTLIQLHFLRLDKTPSCILIDDIGEGLDFERSNKLISVIIDQAEKGHSQLIMTTNDRFIMNKVSLDYWCVLERENGKVNVFNNRNSLKNFQDYEEYGFSNFEFFSKNLFSIDSK